MTLADELEKTNTNLSFNVDQFIIDISMLGRNLSNSIHFKMVCKYKHLLQRNTQQLLKAIIDGYLRQLKLIILFKQIE